MVVAKGIVGTAMFDATGMAARSVGADVPGVTAGIDLDSLVFFPGPVSRASATASASLLPDP